MAGRSPFWLGKHNLTSALMGAYPLRGNTSELHCWLTFAVFNPAQQARYLVPNNLLLDKRHRFTTLGVDCDAILDPAVVFEWFGEGSDFMARWYKSEAFRALPALQQYIALVADDAPSVEEHTRVGDRWELAVRRGGDAIQLMDGKTVSLNAIFSDEDLV